MTLHFRWLQAHAHFSRAMTLVVGVIGVSLLFSALRVIDVAISGGLVESHPAVAATPSASPASTMPADLLIGTQPTAAGVQPVDDTVVVPEAAADAISL